VDNNFQTSFIPKKPLAEDRVPVVAHTSVFSFIATLIFFGALAAAVGMYFYKANLVKSISVMSAELDTARNSFEPSLITQLQTLDRRITDSKILLNNHIVVSPIFSALEINTLKSVQFTKFSYATPSDLSAPVVVHMSGRARDYSSIALQSDQLATNKNIHNSIFSNLALDEKTGMVAFDLTFSVDADLVRFTNHLDELMQQSGSATPPATVPTGTAGTNQTTTAGGTAGLGSSTGTGQIPPPPAGKPVQ